MYITVHTQWQSVLFVWSVDLDAVLLQTLFIDFAFIWKGSVLYQYVCTHFSLRQIADVPLYAKSKVH